MITLYGFAISNYYNKVKFTLLEKGIPFQEQLVIPWQKPPVLKNSPLGKIPFIKTEDGYLSESQVIFEYLEEAFPANNPLYPATTFERAQCRELIQHLEVNVELIARRLYAEAIFGGQVSQETKNEVKTRLDVGLKGLADLLRFSPYALGDRFGAADIVMWPHLQLVALATQKIYGVDLVAEYLPGIADYIQLIESRPHAQKVAKERAEALVTFFKDR